MFSSFYLPNTSYSSNFVDVLYCLCFPPSICCLLHRFGCICFILHSLVGHYKLFLPSGSVAIGNSLNSRFITVIITFPSIYISCMLTSLSSTILQPKSTFFWMHLPEYSTSSFVILCCLAPPSVLPVSFLSIFLEVSLCPSRFLGWFSPCHSDFCSCLFFI